jgi:hypothetical protein
MMDNANTNTTEPKPRKTLTVKLTSGKEEMLVSALRTSKGWRTEAVRYTEPAAKGKTRSGERGATQEHEDFASAQRALDAVVAKLVKVGWTRPERRVLPGMVRAADAFSLANLPKPGSPSRKPA